MWSYGKLNLSYYPNIIYSLDLVHGTKIQYLLHIKHWGALDGEFSISPLTPTDYLPDLRSIR